MLLPASTTTTTTTKTTTTTQPKSSNIPLATTSPVNYIHSPNWPESYNNNEDEEYEVIVGEGKAILFTWTDFEIEPQGSCAWDSVTVVEIVEAREEIAELIILPPSCGLHPPGPFFSQTNRAIVRFKSDGSVTKRGFQLQYEEIDPKSKVTNTVASPNYPKHYSNNLDREQVITVTPGNKIKMVFMFMSIENESSCRYDYVMIQDQDGTILLPRTCGRLDRDLEMISSTHQVAVMFHTDRSVTSNGFLIQWEECQADTI